MESSVRSVFGGAIMTPDAPSAITSPPVAFARRSFRFILPPSALRLALLVARLVLGIRRIKARQRRALLHLFHDPALEALLLGRGGNHLVHEGRGNQHRPVVIDD